MSTELITRITPGTFVSTVKDSPLTNAEIDGNFITLASNKLERSNNLSDLTDISSARNSLNVPSTSGENAFGTWSITVTGNAGTASKLQNARKINGVSFDGSQDITIDTTTYTEGSGISLSGDQIAVNSTVIRTTGNQTISGNISVTGDISATGDITATGNVIATGDITATGNVSGTNLKSTSDIRLKKDLNKIENALLKVNQLNGYTFTFIDSEEKSSGLIAQEVEKILPEVVSENADSVKNISYGNMIGLLVEAIKELKNEVDKLKKNTLRQTI